MITVWEKPQDNGTYLRVSLSSRCTDGVGNVYVCNGRSKNPDMGDKWPAEMCATSKTAKPSVDDGWHIAETF